MREAGSSSDGEGTCRVLLRSSRQLQATGQGLLRHDPLPKTPLPKTPLPKTPVGKIKRKELRAPFWVGRERRVAGN
jgi:hypothetical protein